jgi:uncharacterized protein YijF (DUF1287 family)
MIKVAFVFAFTVGWAFHPEGAPIYRQAPLAPPVVEEAVVARSLPDLEPEIPLAKKIVSAAKIYAQARVPYEMSYPEIGYPGGDIPSDRGLCCDLVVRSFRSAGIDLQELVYVDSLAAREEYLAANRRTGFDRPLNRSWVHRRTSNLNLFFQRHAEVLPTRYGRDTASTFQPGDIIIYLRNGWETWHIALVSDATSPMTGEPLVLDAWMTPGYSSETHRLTAHGTIGGHYRLHENFLERIPPERIARAVESWDRFHEETRPFLVSDREVFPPSPVGHNPYGPQGYNPSATFFGRR